MSKRAGTSKEATDKLVIGIRLKMRKIYSVEEKIRIVLADLRSDESIVNPRASYSLTQPPINSLFFWYLVFGIRCLPLYRLQ